MKIEIMFFAVNLITTGALLLSIIYTAGIVWRVEKKLDVSYKFFLLAIIFLSTAEIISFYPAENNLIFALGIKILQMLFTVCFLFGVFFMRSITRELGEETKEDKQK